MASDLYPLEALRSAAKDFERVAEVELHTEEGRHRVRIAPRGTVDAQRLCDEFCNHALAVTVALRRQGASA